MTSEKKPMQTKNKVLIAAITILILAGAAVGIYYGVKSKNDNNTSNLNQGSNNSTSGGTPTNSGALPTPTVAPPALNGTMINGTLFPFYRLTGDAPAPVGVPGTVYTNCKVPGTFSISFDDGPSQVKFCSGPDFPMFCSPLFQERCNMHHTHPYNQIESCTEEMQKRAQP